MKTLAPMSVITTDDATAFFLEAFTYRPHITEAIQHLVAKSVNPARRLKRHMMSLDYEDSFIYELVAAADWDAIADAFA